MRFAIAVVLVLTACSSGGGGGSDPTPTPTQTATPSPTPTLPANVVRFAALGDQGKGNAGQYAVADAIETHCAAQGCDFVVLLGDNIYDDGVDATTDSQWNEKFEQPYANIDLPFWAVLGNHDYGGTGAGTEFAKGQHQIDYTQVSTKWRMPDNRYSFEAGPATFLALDTNLLLFNMGEDQPPFAASVLSAATTPWIFAVGHHPYVSNGPHGNAGDYDGLQLPPADGRYVKDFFDASICGNVDVYLCGHDHSRQVLDGPASCPMLNVVSGAGASVTDLPGSNVTLYEDLELGFAYVVATTTSLTISMIGTDGSVDFTITR